MMDNVRRLFAVLLSIVLTVSSAASQTYAVAEDIISAAEIVDEMPEELEAVDEPAEETAEETIEEEPAAEEPAEEVPAEEPAAEEPAEEVPAEEPAEEEPAETPVEEPSEEETITEDPADEPADEAPSINPNLPVAQNPSFYSGYVMIIRDTALFIEKTGGKAAYKAEKSAYAYAAKRVNIGTEKERLLAAVNTGSEVLECYISVKDARPLSNEEVEKYLRAVQRDKNAAKYGAASLIAGKVVKLAAQESNAEEPAQSTDDTEQPAPENRADKTLKPFKFGSFTASAKNAVIGTAITFTSSTSGGVEPLSYIFRIFKDGKQITSNTTQTNRRFTYTPTEAGTYYARVTVKDSAGRSTARNSAECVVTAPLKINRVSTTPTSLEMGSSTTYSIGVSGGIAPLQYRFVVMRGDAKVSDTGYIGDRLKKITFSNSGTFTVFGCVKDASGTVVKLRSAPITIVNSFAVSSVKLFNASGKEATLDGTNKVYLVEPGKYTLKTRLAKGCAPFKVKYVLTIEQRNAEGEWEAVSKKDSGFLSADDRANSYAFSIDKPSRITAVITAKDGDTSVTYKKFAPIIASKPLKFVSFTPSAAAVDVNETITFTASVTGGDGKYSYIFRVFKDGVQVTPNTTQTARRFTYTAAEAGTYYARVTVEDEWGHKTARNSAECKVTNKLVLNRVSTGATSISKGQSTTYAMSASGGVEPYTYRFVVLRGGKQAEDTGYIKDRLKKLTFTKAGTFIVRGYVKDANGKIATKDSAELAVTEPLVIKSISTGSEYIETGDTVTFSAAAVGGKQPYKYRFRVMKGSECLFDSKYIDESRCEYTFDKSGEGFKLRADVKDAAGTIVTMYSAAFAVKAEEQPFQEFEFMNLNSTYCAITGYNGNASEIVIPGMSPDGHIVQEIDDSAFRNHAELTKVTIPDSVSRIGVGAFSGCVCLESINIPSGVKKIESGVFYNCKSFTRINIPEGVTTIDGQAFQYCSSLSNVNIPNSVTALGGEAFSNCTSITSITIPDGITYIGYRTFYKCTGLTSATITSSVTDIYNDAFKYCAGLTIYGEAGSRAEAYANEKGFPFVAKVIAEDPSRYTFTNIDSKTCMLTGYNGKRTVITLPSRSPNGRLVTAIGECAFNSKYDLVKVTIPNSVTNIGDYAFSYCSSLTSITIPNSVTNIGDYAFCRSSLTSITIPNSVTSIGRSAFEDCSGLTSITIPNSVTNIVYYAFSYCSSLTSITIPSSVTEIGFDAFEYCPNLTIYGESGSYAQTYANEYNIPFKAQ